LDFGFLEYSPGWSGYSFLRKVLMLATTMATKLVSFTPEALELLMSRGLDLFQDF
jgi:hypothetical protein